MKINFSDEKLEMEQNSIFLAGPTTKGGRYEDSWRKTACNMLEELGFNGIVYVPEYNKKTFDSKKDLEKGALWERYALMSAGAIVFYVDRHMPDNPGLTTNVEFGMYLVKKPEQCILCLPETGENNRYLEWLYKTEIPECKRNNPVCYTMEDALQEAVDLVKRVCTPIETIKQWKKEQKLKK